MQVNTLKKTSMFNKYHLFVSQLAHPVLESLKGTPHGWLIELLYAFNSGMFYPFNTMYSSSSYTYTVFQIVYTMQLFSCPHDSLVITILKTFPLNKCTYLLNCTNIIMNQGLVYFVPVPIWVNFFFGLNFILLCFLI